MKSYEVSHKVPLSRPFNMIEIVLALVIVVIGVIGIMGLFPVGQQANTEARGRNYAFDANDTFLRYFASRAKENWTLIGALPTSKPGAEAETGVVWQTADANSIISAIPPGVIVQYNDLDNDGKFDFRINDSTGDLATDSSGLFRLQHATANNVVDFDGTLRVWTSTATYKSYSAATGEWSGLKPLPSTAGVTLNVEASWPIEVPYAQRQKKTVALDVYSPAESQMGTVNGAIRINQDGRLRVTYLPTTAGLPSALHMSAPETREIFHAGAPTAQVVDIDTDYPAGTTFNFFVLTYGTGMGLGNYEHHAWADPSGTDVPYYDWSESAPDQLNGAYDSVTGNPYCVVTELVPGQKWSLAFEDLPGDRNGDGVADGADWDYDDAVVEVELITLGPPVGTTVGVGGSININPNNKPDMEFTLTKPDGSLITRDMLHDGFVSGYEGGAISVVVRPKGNGNQNGMTVDGAPYDLENKHCYAITSTDMTVRVWNDRIHNGKAMGRWWIDIDANDATIVITH